MGRKSREAAAAAVETETETPPVPEEPKWEAPALPDRKRENRIPEYARKNTEPPRRDVFLTLCDIWIERFRDPGQTRTASGGALALLADWLGARRQHISMWRGEDRAHEAPWWVILAMADALGLAVLMEADRLMLIPKPERSTRGARSSGGPGRGKSGGEA